MFQDTDEINKDDWKKAYTWIKQNGRIFINQVDHYIMQKSKYDLLLQDYQKICQTLMFILLLMKQ